MQLSAPSRLLMQELLSALCRGFWGSSHKAEPRNPPKTNMTTEYKKIHLDREGDMITDTDVHDCKLDTHGFCNHPTHKQI